MEATDDSSFRCSGKFSFSVMPIIPAAMAKLLLVYCVEQFTMAASIFPLSSSLVPSNPSRHVSWSVTTALNHVLRSSILEAFSSGSTGADCIGEIESLSRSIALSNSSLQSRRAAASCLSLAGDSNDPAKVDGDGERELEDLGGDARVSGRGDAGDAGVRVGRHAAHGLDGIRHGRGRGRPPARGGDADGDDGNEEDDGGGGYEDETPPRRAAELSARDLAPLLVTFEAPDGVHCYC